MVQQWFMIHSKIENTISHLHYISGDWYIKKTTFNRTSEYTAAVRGYHYFKSISQPNENEVLVCQFENGNNYDMFVIKTCDQRGTLVDHLPRKLSLLQNLSLIVVQQYLLCLAEHIIVDLFSSRVGWRPHAKYQFPCAGSA